MNKKILISGGSGMIGSAICKKLIQNDYDVAILSRSSSVEWIKTFQWNYQEGKIDPEAMEFADIVIHLAGENISSGRWTKAEKLRIQESRYKTGQLLFEAIQKAKNPPSHLLSASAVGYYGAITTDKIFEETDAPGEDFLADTVIKWEKSLEPIKDLGITVKKVRIGLVLASQGGALEKMINPVQWGLGAALGSGKQWMPWISLRDLVRLFIYLLENETAAEVYNAVAPQHVTNNTFMKTLASILGKPFVLPNVPGLVLRAALGEMAVLVLKGSRVSSKSIMETGFEFEDTELEDILQRIIRERNQSK